MKDIKITIATAPSRTSKVWKNKETTWKALVEKCRETKRTGETVAEYAKMDKTQQSARKDVGGFVGGYLKDGVRKNGQVAYRSLATLDIDYGTAEVWEDFTTAFSCAAMIYSTHKHAPNSPRFRLVIPFSRKVQPWEYEPICRKIAEAIGIEMFDHTTYELPRLFYWPSTSEDGVYVFESQEGEPLDVDGILASYMDPKDASSWPYGTRETVSISREIKKAGDPLQKPGVIGAFCRSYTIGEAIDTFLTEFYEPTAMPDRYTYKGGSVAGGLVCYNDAFAYSHHDTDPASRTLCNAFDLIRIHLFGDRDKKTYEDITKAPSYAEMVAFASSDKKTSKTMIRERQQSAAEDFDGFGSDDEDGDTWQDRLSKDKRGIQSCISNIILILTHDKALKGKLWHDDFSGYDNADDLPWNRVSDAWSDKDDSNLRVLMDTRYGIQGREKIADALDFVFMRNRRHPVKEYLLDIEDKWDGVPRLERLIIDYIGAEDNELNRQMTRKHFTAAVKRVMQPGCKYDYCLIMTGGEGIGKSTMLKIMGGEWFSDSIVTTEGKEGMESLRQAWVIELAELASIKRSDVEQVKSFISKQEDRYRAAYGKRTTPYKRQCVFFGTTNEASFLKGDTGNRRFWVIPVDASLRKYDGDIFARIEDDRDQLWAEAVHFYRLGEKLYLDKEMEEAARARQQEFNVDNDDPVPGLLDEYLAQRIPADWYNWDIQRRRAFFQQRDPLEAESVERTKIYAGEFLYEMLGLTPKDKDHPYKLKQVNKLMKAKEGWTERRVRVAGYGSQKGFTRDGSDDEKDEDA